MTTKHEQAGETWPDIEILSQVIQQHAQSCESGQFEMPIDIARYIARGVAEHIRSARVIAAHLASLRRKGNGEAMTTEEIQADASHAETPQEICDAANRLSISGGFNACLIRAMAVVIRNDRTQIDSLVKRVLNLEQQHAAPAPPAPPVSRIQANCSHGVIDG